MPEWQSCNWDDKYECKIEYTHYAITETHSWLPSFQKQTNEGGNQEHVSSITNPLFLMILH